MAKKAIIVGASGLIGSSLLDILLQRAEYTEVLILVRKELSIKNSKLKQLVVDFDKLPAYSDSITGDVIFSCLGSTRKKTPDLTNYRKVDHDYPFEIAKIGYKNKINQFHLVSSMGANAGASNFYSKIKGEIENDIKQVGFKSLFVYRPSLLVGERNERRPLEKVLFALAKVIDPLLIGDLKKYRSIPADTVAMAMFKQSLIKQEGIFVYPSDKIKELS